MGFPLASVTWLRACLLHLYPTPIPASFALASALASPRLVSHISERVTPCFSHDAPSHAIFCTDLGATRKRHGFIHLRSPGRAHQVRAAHSLLPAGKRRHSVDAPVETDTFRSSLAPDDIPIKLRCAICSKLAVNAFRLPCCEQAICETCTCGLQRDPQPGTNLI